MTKAIELAEHYENKAKKFQPTGDARFRLNELTTELRRLAAVEQENANLLAANKYTSDLLNQALQELADLKAAMGEPFGYFKAEPFSWTDCSELDPDAIPLYAMPKNKLKDSK